MQELKSIGVLGAGVMGSQLALLCAESGLDVKIRDVEEKFLERGRTIIESHLNRRIKKGKLTEEGKKDLLGKIGFTLNVDDAVKGADYIIEAVTETMDVKHELFKEAYQYAPKHAIF
ncbi:MAG: 3-hydroxyacyl-CoA dehydrogenase NAD-binding domain-containing protein, partial [Thermodesulfobacteriota bacterium]|nr:3-hydroxyacyl-CoA dehydrogenase NAD-binding domain-containing protein [Thermodesulfobacteriota bacterium]